MTDKPIVVKSTVSFSGLLVPLSFVALLVMKGAGVVTWSWWWITSPLWGPLALFVGVLTLCGVVWLLAKGIAYLAERAWYVISPKYRHRVKARKAFGKIVDQAVRRAVYGDDKAPNRDGHVWRF